MNVLMLLGCLAELALALLGLLLFMRWRERGLIARLGTRTESVRTAFTEDLEEIRIEIAGLRDLRVALPGRGPEPEDALPSMPLPPAPPPPPQPADVRASVVDLHRRGETVAWIAAALGIPRADVKMMILVHDRGGR